MVDVSDPTAPDSVGAYYTGDTHHVCVSESFAYLSSIHVAIEGTQGWLSIVNVSEPGNPAFAWETVAECGDNLSGFGDIFVSEDYAYTVCENAGMIFQVRNVSDPYHPSLVGECWLPAYTASGIVVTGSHAYLAVQGGVLIVDVSDPTRPQSVGSYDTPGLAKDVFVSGHYAYVACGDAGLQIMDVSDPEHPVLAGSYDTFGDARSVYVQRDYVYVADSSSLVILRFDPFATPVELSAFDATVLPTGIHIAWSTSFEADLLGFRVHRASRPNGDYVRLSELIEPSGPCRFHDTDVTAGTTYFYRLEALDRSGGSEFFGPVAATAIGTAGSPGFALLQSQPNPFVAGQGGTSIGFLLAKPGLVRLRVFDAAGRLVRLLVDEPLGAGPHTSWWDGRSEQGEEVGSGIYYCRLDAGAFTESRTLVKLR
jgi:hypothetical protein